MEIHLATDDVVQAFGTGDIVMSIKTLSEAKQGLLRGCGIFQSYRAFFSSLNASQSMLERSRLRAMVALSRQKDCSGSLEPTRVKDCSGCA